MSYLRVGAVPVQSDGLNSTLSPVVYGDIALHIKQIDNTHTNMTRTVRKKTCYSGTGMLF